MHPIVVKTGTNVLTTDSGRLDLNNVRYLVDQIAALMAKKIPVIWVSSGAITCGAQKLEKRPQSTEEKQMAAAVGQSILMSEYGRFFDQKGITVGQVLVTRDNFADASRAENIRHTMKLLLERGILPIVNENDTVASEEITFGDNDELSARMAVLMGAEKLLLLTNQSGLYNSDPDKNPKAMLIAEVEKVNFDIESFVDDTYSKFGSGGMASKVQAARMATEAGIDVYVASGRERDVMIKILEGARVGTHFKAQR